MKKKPFSWRRNGDDVSPHSKYGINPDTYSQYHAYTHSRIWSYQYMNTPNNCSTPINIVLDPGIPEDSIIVDNTPTPPALPSCSASEMTAIREYAELMAAEMAEEDD